MIPSFGERYPEGIPLLISAFQAANITESRTVKSWTSRNTFVLGFIRRTVPAGFRMGDILSFARMALDFLRLPIDMEFFTALMLSFGQTEKSPAKANIRKASRRASGIFTVKRVPYMQ